MADNKKYLSKISKDGNIIYMKDEEARAAIPTTASVATCESIIDELT